MTRVFNKTTQVTTITVERTRQEQLGDRGDGAGAGVHSAGGHARRGLRGAGRTRVRSGDSLERGRSHVLSWPSPSATTCRVRLDRSDRSQAVDLTDHIFRIYFMVHDGDQHQSAAMSATTARPSSSNRRTPRADPDTGAPTGAPVSPFVEVTGVIVQRQASEIETSAAG